MERTICIFLLLLAVTKADDDQMPTNWCRLQGDICVFNDVELNRAHPRFRPAAENVAKAKEILFTGSIISVFTDDICRQFPHIDALRVMNTSVEEVMPDALNLCTNLKVINFQSNEIQELDVDVFRRNSKLEEIYLGHNQLVALPDSIFSSQPELKLLWVEDNQLTEFPAELVQNNAAIEKLAISSNHLSSIDEQKLLTFLPKLSTIWYNNNEFSCYHVREMNVLFFERGIEVIIGAHGKERFYPIQLIDEIECAPDESWTSAYYRKEKDIPVSISDVAKKGEADKCDNNCMETLQSVVINTVEKQLEDLKKENKELEDMIQKLSDFILKKQ